MLLNCGTGEDSRVPWTARRSNQSILKEINPEYSLEGLLLKLWHFGHLMRRTDSLEKTLTLGKTEGKRKRGWQRMKWLRQHHWPNGHAAAVAAKSFQPLPTLCDPTDGSPRGSPVPGILQTRTLDWVAISFSKAWKWKVKVKLLSRVRLSATPWTAAYQAPPSMGLSRQEYWSGLPVPSPNGHESEQIRGDSEGHKSLVCNSSWGHKESYTI